MKNVFTILIALSLVSAMLLSFASCGSTETTEEIEVFTTDPVEYTKSATPVGKTSEEVLSYFNSIVNSVKIEKPAVSYRFEKNVPNDSIKITKKGQEEAEEIDPSLKKINKSAQGIKNMILENIKKTTGDIAMGQDSTEVLFKKGENWSSVLKIADVDYATIKEVGDKYYIDIVFDDVAKNGDTSSLVKAFDLRDKDEILASEEFKKVSVYFDFVDYDVAYSGCKITAVVNRLTDEVININYYKAANVTAHMVGVGDYKDVGEVSVIFVLEDKSNFDMNWVDERPTSPLETVTGK